MNWIPLLKLTDHGTEFGLSEGEWSVQTKSGEIVSVASHPHAFLPFIEIDFHLAEKKIHNSVSSKGLLGKKIPASPLFDAIRCGLRAPSEYWQSLALKRVLQCSEQNSFLNDVLTLEKTGATQRVRHEAQKVAREISAA
jgi:hypothetical protein